MRSLFQPDPGKLGGFTVEIATDKGVKGYGEGGMAGGEIVTQHLTKLLLNEDPFKIERIWDIMWRSTMYYGLPPYDYEGYGRLRQAIQSTRIVSGEHEYTRYGFRQLLEHEAAA